MSINAPIHVQTNITNAPIQLPVRHSVLANLDGAPTNGAIWFDGTDFRAYKASSAKTLLAYTQGASVADATGGALVDVEARAAVNALISRIEALGLIIPV